LACNRIEYDHRHGYRGPEAYANLPEEGAERDAVVERLLQEANDSDGLLPCVVLEAGPALVRGVFADGEPVEITGDGLKFASRSLGDKAPTATRIRPGALIRVARDTKGHWEITQVPQAEAALVSLRPSDGAILSLIGGFDFDRNKFNHVTQAQRQPGSAFKPFIYSAALEKGFTPATVVNDAPFFVPADKAGGEDWEPKNYDGKFDGPMRIRAALAKSKNLVTVRVMQAIGPQYAQDYIARFGFDPKLHPPFLTSPQLNINSVSGGYLPPIKQWNDLTRATTTFGQGVSVTPLQMVGAYAVFANGGYRIAPYVIARIVDAKGNVLSEAAPVVAGGSAERAIDPRNAWIMTSLLKDVIRVGTATRALSLNRTDLAGKTGTTNENVDAWFCGFNAAIVGVSWIGFDQPRTLGVDETGARAGLPIWILDMAKVLKGTPEASLPMPNGIVAVPINAETGLRDEGSGLTEYFFAEYPPRGREESLVPGKSGKDVRDQLF